MIEKGKQLTLSQRNKIEEMLNQRRRKFEIANELDKTQSTIAREINRHKILKPHHIYKSFLEYLIYTEALQDTKMEEII